MSGGLERLSTQGDICSDTWLKWESGSGIVEILCTGPEAALDLACSHFQKSKESSVDEANERRGGCEAKWQERKKLGEQIIQDFQAMVRILHFLPTRGAKLEQRRVVIYPSLAMLHPPTPLHSPVRLCTRVQPTGKWPVWCDSSNIISKIQLGKFYLKEVPWGKSVWFLQVQA